MSKASQVFAFFLLLIFIFVFAVQLVSLKKASVEIENLRKIKEERDAELKRTQLEIIRLMKENEELRKKSLLQAGSKVRKNTDTDIDKESLEEEWRKELSKALNNLTNLIEKNEEDYVRTERGPLFRRAPIDLPKQLKERLQEHINRIFEMLANSIHLTDEQKVALKDRLVDNEKIKELDKLLEEYDKIPKPVSEEDREKFREILSKIMELLRKGFMTNDYNKIKSELQTTLTQQQYQDLQRYSQEKVQRTIERNYLDSVELLSERLGIHLNTAQMEKYKKSVNEFYNKIYEDAIYLGGNLILPNEKLEQLNKFSEGGNIKGPFPLPTFPLGRFRDSNLSIIKETGKNIFTPEQMQKIDKLLEQRKNRQ